MTEEEKNLIVKTNKLVMTISVVGILSIALVASVALMSMAQQSKHAMDSAVEAFGIYIGTDYEYGTISQTVEVGDTND